MPDYGIVAAPHRTGLAVQPRRRPSARVDADRSCYQSLIRTPFIWADPAGPQARRSPALCSTVDLAPSILARAGVPAFNGMNGQVLPCVPGAAPERQSVLVEDEVQRVLFGFDSPPRLRTLVTARWRLTVYANASWGELYDLESDPHELDNLWEDPGHRALRGELMTELVHETAVR